MRDRYSSCISVIDFRFEFTAKNNIHPQTPVEDAMQKEIIFFGISLQFKEMNLHWKRVKNIGMSSYLVVPPTIIKNDKCFRS